MQGKGKAGIDLDSVNEAFFFDGSRCLHIYREDEIKGLLYEEDGSEEILGRRADSKIQRY